MGDQPDTQSGARRRRLLAQLTTTLAAWLVAFLMVIALLTLFGDILASLPIGLRALAISGVLVTLMVNLIMPMLGPAVARLLAGGPSSSPTAGKPSAAPEHASTGVTVVLPSDQAPTDDPVPAPAQPGQI